MNEKQEALLKKWGSDSPVSNTSTLFGNQETQEKMQQNWEAKVMGKNKAEFEKQCKLEFETQWKQEFEKQYKPAFEKQWKQEFEKKFKPEFEKNFKPEFEQKWKLEFEQKLKEELLKQQSDNSPAKQALELFHSTDLLFSFSSTLKEIQILKKSMKNIPTQIDTFSENLETAKTNFLSTTSQKDLNARKREFGDACMNAIEKVRLTLKNDSGVTYEPFLKWLAKLVSVVVSVLCVGIPNYLSGRDQFSLFAYKTNIEKRTDQLEAEINNTMY